MLGWPPTGDSPGMRVFPVLTAALLALGCGGSVVDDGADGSVVEAPGDEPGRPSKGLPRAPLGPCRGAFLPESDPHRACNWVANGECYEDRDDACGCECRRTRGDLCVSGFPGTPGSRVPVDCI